MKQTLINSLTKEQLRSIVGQVITVEETKLNKMNKKTCLKHVKELSYKQITELLK